MSNNMKLVEIALDDIEVGARLRMPDLVAIEGLSASIEAHGLMSPIEVVKISYNGLNKLASDGSYQLVCGGHRYAAFRTLGRDVIPAFVVKGSKDQLRMREILENVSRSELTKLERAVFTAELREVVERVHAALSPSCLRAGPTEYRSAPPRKAFRLFVEAVHQPFRGGSDCAAMAFTGMADAN